MKQNEEVNVFDEKTKYLPIEEYLELCKSSLNRTLNRIDKGKEPTEVSAELKRLDIKIVTLKKLVKAIDSKTLLPFVDKRKGFDIGSALNRLCEDIIKLRAKKN